MAEKAAKSGDAEQSVVDLQSDERWQDRLAEARERRAQTLKEQGRDDGARRKPRKPWDEEVTPIAQRPAEPAAKPKREFDFLDRMDVLKRVTGLDKKGKREPAASKPLPGNNWYPGDDDGPDETVPIDVHPSHPAQPDAPAQIPIVEAADKRRDEPAPIEAVPLDVPTQSPIVGADIERPKTRSRSSVDSVFDEASFGQDVPEPPTSLLLQLSDPPPPSSASRPWLAQKDKVDQVVLPPPETAKTNQSDDIAAKKKRRRVPAWISVAALFLIAIGVGPLAVYSPWQPKAIGPATPFFGTQPALGFTSPLVGIPRTTTAGEWSPESVVGPVGPRSTGQTFPPAFVRHIAPFEMSPLFGVTDVDVNLPPPAAALPGVPLSPPPAPRLTNNGFRLRR